MECDQMRFIWKLAEKFKGHLRYSHGMWTNEAFMMVGLAEKFIGLLWKSYRMC